MRSRPRYGACCLSLASASVRRSASTSQFGVQQLFDDHDVLDFSVSSLITDSRPSTPTSLPQDEKAKYQEEFEKQMKEFEAERAKFKEQHPDKAKDDDDYDDSKFYEEDATVLQRVDERVQQLQSGGAVQTVQPGQTAPPSAGGGLLQHEKNEMLQTLRDLTQSLRDQKQYINEIFTKTYNLEQKWGQGAPQGGGGGGGVDNSMHQKVDSLLNEVRAVRANQLQHSGGGAVSCPNITCLSSSLFLAVILIQGLVIVVMIFVRDSTRRVFTKFLFQKQTRQGEVLL
ncbi:hypothetical protein OSTOST_23244, partial [Ostertagia ostertagi]